MTKQAEPAAGIFTPEDYVTDIGRVAESVKPAIVTPEDNVGVEGGP